MDPQLVTDVFWHSVVVAFVDDKHDIFGADVIFIAIRTGDKIIYGADLFFTKKIWLEVAEP